ncbi:MAG: energy transducer TonB [Ignavibacteriales bacterium]|nr:energy transducer TonB [Ignavibacteriales bacterium]MBK7980533.1 energy transducer TonB [Ignavibacteriota bacterium]
MSKKIILVFNLLILIILGSITEIKSELQNDEYLAFAEQMPEPVGGLEGIYKAIKYPELAIKSGVQGKVYVLAFINEDGKVEDVKIVKGIGAGCDEATIEAVKKSKFVPGKSAGKNVKVKMSLQIQFKLT